MVVASSRGPVASKSVSVVKWTGATAPPVDVFLEIPGSSGNCDAAGGSCVIVYIRNMAADLIVNTKTHASPEVNSLLS
jgi:hypothetical protein